MNLQSLNKIFYLFCVVGFWGVIFILSLNEEKFHTAFGIAGFIGFFGLVGYSIHSMFQIGRNQTLPILNRAFFILILICGSVFFGTILGYLIIGTRRDESNILLYLFGEQSS